jgi:predicted kinase
VPLDAPFVIAVGGVMGAGKSTLAAALGRALAAPVVGSDRTRKALAGLPPTARGGPALYTGARTGQTYAQVLRQAACVAGAGRGVILDASFSRRHFRAQAAAMAAAAGARFVMLEARCADREVLRQRLRARAAGPSVSDAREDLLDAFVRAFEAVAPDEPGVHLVVDTAASAPAAADAALAALAGAGILPAGERCRS